MSGLPSDSLALHFQQLSLSLSLSLSLRLFPMSAKSSRKRDTPQPNNPKRHQLSCESIYINAAAKRREPLSVVTLYMFVLCGMSQSVVKRSFVPRDGLGRFHCMHGRHNIPLGYPGGLEALPLCCQFSPRSLY